MEAYPEDYIVHNLPLFLVSGLENKVKEAGSQDKASTLLQDGGFSIRIDAPCIQSPLAQHLLHALLKHDATDAPWSAKYATRAEQQYACRIRSVGRTYTLPPRKAPPPPHSSPQIDAYSSPASSMVLHSTLSPLSPSSPLYADGIMTPLWIAKHQTYLPSVLIVFFSLFSDSKVSTLEDNKIKSEIANTRNVFASVSYKTKLVFVLVGDGAIESSEAEDRANNIRRATSTDSRSLSYLPGTVPTDTFLDFASSLMSTVYQTSIEHYRDLSKHARRKRNRNTAPQPTTQPSSSSVPILNSQGWSVRYEFKLGVLAEFRQEMEAAVRNYETAYDILIGPEVFGTIPRRSPRFNENRLLADVIAMRIIRGFLWMGQTTNAVRTWLAHRDAVSDIVTRRGAGTGNYGWESWQVVWSRSMSELIQRSQVLSISTDNSSGVSIKPILVHTEKTLVTSDRFMPWESLHHHGYWLNLAQRHTQRRRGYALNIAEADRVPPDRLRASSIGSKDYPYERYMALEPYQEYPMDGRNGPDYTEAILQDLDKAIEQFSVREQLDMAFFLQFRKAQELLHSSSWNEAAILLNPLWRDPRLRRTGWWLLLGEIGKALWHCAVQARHTESLHILCWEASNPQLNAIMALHSGINYVQPDSIAESPPLNLVSNSAVCRITSRFAFAIDEGYAGQSLRAQLVVRCFGQRSDARVRLLSIRIVFDGGIRPISLVHGGQQNPSSEAGSIQIVEAAPLVTSSELADYAGQNLTSSLGSLTAVMDLTPAEGSTRVYELELTPREAGEVSVASITLQIEQDGCEITSVTAREDVASGEWWETQRGRPTSRRHGKMRDVASISVLPKPPKLGVRARFVHLTHYTNDDIELYVEVTNEEDEIVNGHIQVKLVSASGSAISLAWKSPNGSVASERPDGDELVQVLPQISMDNLAVGQSALHSIIITRTDEAINHALEIFTTYTLTSAAETPLMKLTTIDLSVIRPFEANFNFHPRRHPDDWPQFFSASSISRQSTDATGIKQQYLVSAMIQSFASDDVHIESTSLIARKLMGHVSCSTSFATVQPDMGQVSGSLGQGTIVLESRKTSRLNFDAVLQKLVLGDGQPAAVDFEMEIKWKRTNSDRMNTSTLQVPRFLVPGSEPRVLLRLAHGISPDVNILEYTIENATMHFLTFNLSMESSDEFAFSGPKSKAVSLVPVSRYDVQYHIMPTDVKEWIRINLQVVDAYFGQTLKIQPASDGVRVNKEGHVLVKIQA